MTETAIYAAGGVVLARRRREAHGAAHPPHRATATSRCPRARSIPGETLPETAVREIAEETGLRVALGVPLGVVEYHAAEQAARRSCTTGRPR